MPICLNQVSIYTIQFVATLRAHGFSLSPPLELSYKLSDFDASMFPHKNMCATMNFSQAIKEYVHNRRPLKFAGFQFASRYSYILMIVIICSHQIFSW